MKFGPLGTVARSCRQTCPGRIAAEKVGIEVQLPEELEVSVDTVHAVGVARSGRITVGHNRADPGTSGEIAPDSADDIVIGRDRVRLLSFHGQEADIVVPDLPGHTSAPDVPPP